MPSLKSLCFIVIVSTITLLESCQAQQPILSQRDVTDAFLGVLHGMANGDFARGILRQIGVVSREEGKTSFSDSFKRNETFRLVLIHF